MDTNPIWGSDWEQVRSLWPLDPVVAHCNHGSFGAVPSSVLAQQDELRHQMAANPMRWFDRELLDRVLKAREAVASFLDADFDGLALVSNVSAGVSAVVQSMSLDRGDEVLSSDHTYGAVTYALDRLCARTGARHVVASIPFDSSEEEVSTIFADHCTARTRLVVVEQVTSSTARRFPVEAVVKVAHDADAAVLVDGAHAPGMLDFQVRSIGADFWTGNLHKWACAPAGAGALWVAPRWRATMRSLVVSWREAEGFPGSFDQVGTDDLSAWLATPYSLELLASLGWERVRLHNETLVRSAQGIVAEIIGTRPDELRHDSGVSMAVVQLPRGVADTMDGVRALRDYLANRAVEAAIVCWGGRGAIRLSAEAYNRPADYERLALGVRDYLRH